MQAPLGIPNISLLLPVRDAQVPARPPQPAGLASQRPFELQKCCPQLIAAPHLFPATERDWGCATHPVLSEAQPPERQTPVNNPRWTAARRVVLAGADGLAAGAAAPDRGPKRCVLKLGSRVRRGKAGEEAKLGYSQRLATSSQEAFLNICPNFVTGGGGLKADVTKLS